MSRELEVNDYKQPKNKLYDQEVMENQQNRVFEYQKIYDRSGRQKDNANLLNAKNILNEMLEHNKKAAELIKNEAEIRDKKRNNRRSMLEPFIKGVNELVNRTEDYKKEIDKEIPIQNGKTSSVTELSTKTAELTALDQTIGKQNSEVKDLTTSIETKEQRIQQIKDKNFFKRWLFHRNEKANLKNEVVIDKNSLVNAKNSLSELKTSRRELAQTISTILPPIQKHCKEVQVRFPNEQSKIENKISTLSKKLNQLDVPGSDVQTGKKIITLEEKLEQCQKMLTQSNQTLNQTLNTNVVKDQQRPFADLKTCAQDQTHEKGSANIHAKSPNKSNKQKQPATGR